MRTWSWSLTSLLASAVSCDLSPGLVGSEDVGSDIDGACVPSATRDVRGNEFLTVCDPTSGLPALDATTGAVSEESGDMPGTLDRALDGSPPDCASCQRAFEETMALARATMDACEHAGARMARASCEERHLMPNGTLVTDYECSHDGAVYRCRGPGIDRCLDYFVRGMPGSSEGVALSVTFQVPLSASATRTVNATYSPTVGYYLTCLSLRFPIETQAGTERTMCGRRVLAAQAGVCSF